MAGADENSRAFPASGWFDGQNKLAWCVIVRVELAPPKSYIVAHGAIPVGSGRSFDAIAHGRYAGDLIVHKDSEK
jgi:hypothetical protein